MHTFEHCAADRAVIHTVLFLFGRSVKMLIIMSHIAIRFSLFLTLQYHFLSLSPPFSPLSFSSVHSFALSQTVLHRKALVFAHSNCSMHRDVNCSMHHMPHDVMIDHASHPLPSFVVLSLFSPFFPSSLLLTAAQSTRFRPLKRYYAPRRQAP